MTRGVRLWVWISMAISAWVGVGSCSGLVSEGDFFGALIALVIIMPLFFWVLATLGAAVINVLGIAGQVMDAQVYESAAIQGKERVIYTTGDGTEPIASASPRVARTEPGAALEPEGAATAAAFGAWLASRDFGEEGDARRGDTVGRPVEREGAFAAAFDSTSRGPMAEDDTRDYDGDPEDW